MAGLDAGAEGEEQLAELFALVVVWGGRRRTRTQQRRGDSRPGELERLAGVLDAGTLSVPIQATYTLGQADQALKALTTQHTQGKRSITVP